MRVIEWDARVWNETVARAAAVPERYLSVDHRVIAAANVEFKRLEAEVERWRGPFQSLYDASHDVIRRVGGDQGAPSHVDMLAALTRALTDARAILEPSPTDKERAP